MLNPTIATIEQLVSFIADLGDREAVGFKRPLETYLRAFLRLVQQHRDTACSPAVAASIFADAFQSEPFPFDMQWLQYDETPPGSNANQDFGYLHHILCFQIADLYRLEQAGLLNVSPLVLYGGIHSPTDSSWYNFTVADYLEAASRGFYDHCKHFERLSDQQAAPERSAHILSFFSELELIGRPLDSVACSWRDLGEMLELGRLYE
jgi:hypothetical protein